MYISGCSRSRSRSCTGHRHRSSSRSHSHSRSNRKHYSQRSPHHRHYKDNIFSHSRALDSQNSHQKVKGETKEAEKELRNSERVKTRQNESDNPVQQESSAINVELAFQDFENFIRQLKDKQNAN